MQLSGKCGPVKYKYLTTKFLKFMSKKMSSNYAENKVAE